MFLLRYDFSMPENETTPFAENITISLPPPTLIIQDD